MRRELPSELPDAARAYLESLPPGRVVGFPLTDLDQTNVPAWKIALFLDDTRALPGVMPSGYGYGMSDEEAIIGAAAELAEMICPTLRLINEPKRAGTYTKLSREVGAGGIVDPLTLCLPAGCPVDHGTELVWVNASRVATGEAVLVPIDVVALDVHELPHGYRPFTTFITNGVGAGPDLDWAVGHGLLECLQRDGNGTVFRALDQGVVLKLPKDLDPATRRLLDHLDAIGIEVIPKLATTEFDLANVYVVGFDRDPAEPRSPIMLSACGEACDPDRNRALRKALLEFCSARVRKAYCHGPLENALAVAPASYVSDFLSAAMPSLLLEESRAVTEMTAWATLDTSDMRRLLSDRVFSKSEGVSFDSLPSTPSPDTRTRGRLASERLTALGFDVLYVDCSPPDRSVAVVKVIVPGLEVETMSYYRIGERNTRKLIERDSNLIRFGAQTETLRPIRLTPEALDRLGGRQPYLDTAAVDSTVGRLYPLYREPEAHHVAYRLSRSRADSAKPPAHVRAGYGP